MLFCLRVRVVSFAAPPPRNEVLLNKTSEPMAVTAAPLRLPQAALHFIAFLQDAESKQPRRRLRALTLYYGNDARGRRMLVSKVTRVATMQKRKKKKKRWRKTGRDERLLRRSIRESLLPASTRLTVAF